MAACPLWLFEAGPDVQASLCTVRCLGRLGSTCLLEVHADFEPVAACGRLEITLWAAACCAVQLQGGAAAQWGCQRLVVGRDLVDTLEGKLGVKLKQLGAVSGAQLDGCTYRHPIFNRTSPLVIGGDYITTESGTGLVHTAPGHGQEDYQVGEGVERPRRL